MLAPVSLLERVLQAQPAATATRHDAAATTSASVSFSFSFAIASTLLCQLDAVSAARVLLLVNKRVQSLSNELPPHVWTAMAATQFPASPFAPFDPVETDWRAFWRCNALACFDSTVELVPELMLDGITMHVTCEQRPWLLDCRVPADWAGAVLREELLQISVSMETTEESARSAVMTLSRAGLAFNHQLTGRSIWSSPLGALQTLLVTEEEEKENEEATNVVLRLASADRQVSVRGLSIDGASAWVTAIAALRQRLRADRQCHRHHHQRNRNRRRSGDDSFVVWMASSRDDARSDRSTRSSAAMLQAVVPYPFPTRLSLTSFLESLRLRRREEASQRQRLRRRVARWKERSKQHVWLVCAALFGPGDDTLPLSPEQLKQAQDNNNNGNSSSSSARSSQASTLCDLADLADMTSFDDDDEMEDEEEDDDEDESQQQQHHVDLSDADDDDNQSSIAAKRSSRFGFRDRLRRSLSSSLRSSRQLLTERPALDQRIETIVQRTLRDESTFEGQVCLRFLEKQRSFRLTTAVAGRFYLGQVRGVIGDLVAFIMTYRRDVLATDADDQRLLPQNEENKDDNEAVTFAVRCAVEQYVCESLQDELWQWAAMATPSLVRPRRSHKQLHKWSALPATSTEFGLPHDVARAVEGDATVAMAVTRLREIGQHTAPSRKMQSLVDACHALSAFLAARGERRASGSTSSSVSSVDADAFLPLLIFAVARSDMRDAFLQPMLLAELFPFTTQHGERPYYLTMLDASLQYIQTNS